MAKYFTIAFFILVLLGQQQQYTALPIIFTYIGSSSSTITLSKYIISFLKLLKPQEKTPKDDIYYLVKDLNSKVNADMVTILDTLKDLPSIIRLTLKKETLEGYFSEIGRVFEEAVRMKLNVEDNKIERNNSRYEHFRGNNEGLIDHSIYEIRRILTDADTNFFLAQKFNADLKEFEIVCKTGLSHLQLVDHMLGNLKIATAQYYITKKLMYDFLELDGQEDYTTTKATLLENVNLDYKTAVKNFKSIMSSASQELWKCDPCGGYNDSIRFSDKTDSTFTELRAYSKYIVHENNFEDKGGICETTKCKAITKLDKCGNSNTILCPKVRLCPGNLICKQFTYNRWSNLQSAQICMNKNSTAFHRYKSIVLSTQSDDYRCTDGKTVTAKNTVFQQQLGRAYYCNYCDCVCQEKDYFISYHYATADVYSNKVVTGAKLVVEDNTLYVQIQEGTLLENGTIDIDTVSWKPINKTNTQRSRISWNGLKEIALTKIIIPTDRVVTGLQFKEIVKNRIGLLLYSTNFDFKSGKLNPLPNDVPIIDLPQPGTVKYDLSNNDVPTKRRDNNPQSSDDHYTEFTATSFVKDGGQSMIPFIDTQNLSANTLLSGAGLYIRGQPGYGGFLGIKLYTFDIRGFIDNNTGF